MRVVHLPQTSHRLVVIPGGLALVLSSTSEPFNATESGVDRREAFRSAFAVARAAWWVVAQHIASHIVIGAI